MSVRPSVCPSVHPSVAARSTRVMAISLVIFYCSNQTSIAPFQCIIVADVSKRNLIGPELAYVYCLVPWFSGWTHKWRVFNEDVLFYLRLFNCLTLRLQKSGFCGAFMKLQLEHQTGCKTFVFLFLFVFALARFFVWNALVVQNLSKYRGSFIFSLIYKGISNPIQSFVKASKLVSLMNAFRFLFFGNFF